MAKARKVVLDTNVLLSAIFFGGKPKKVLLLTKRNKILALSNKILEELFEKLIHKFEQSPSWSKGVIRDLLEDSYVASIAGVKRYEVDDPKDHMVIETAEESGANMIVTGDRHLLDLGRFGGIEIMTPSEYLKRKS